MLTNLTFLDPEPRAGGEPGLPRRAGALHPEGVRRRADAADAAAGGGRQGALEVRLPRGRAAAGGRLAAAQRLRPRPRPARAGALRARRVQGGKAVSST